MLFSVIRYSKYYNYNDRAIKLFDLHGYYRNLVYTIYIFSSNILEDKVFVACLRWPGIGRYNYET